jgi:hypothetical protein
MGGYCETGEHDPAIVEVVEENALDPVLVDSKVKVIAPGSERTRAQGTGSGGDAPADMSAADDGRNGPATRSGRVNAKRRKQAYMYIFPVYNMADD